MNLLYVEMIKAEIHNFTTKSKKHIIEMVPTSSPLDFQQNISR